jgi:hypothetical protein
MAASVSPISLLFLHQHFVTPSIMRWSTVLYIRVGLWQCRKWRYVTSKAMLSSALFQPWYLLHLHQFNCPQAAMLWGSPNRPTPRDFTWETTDSTWHCSSPSFWLQSWELKLEQPFSNSCPIENMKDDYCCFKSLRFDMNFYAAINN